MNQTKIQLHNEEARHTELYYKYHIPVVTVLLMAAIACEWWYIMAGALIYIFGQLE